MFYSLLEVFEMLEDNQIATCVSGKLKGDSMYYVDDQMHYEELNEDENAFSNYGYVLIRTENDIEKYADTVWIIEEE